MSEDSLKEVAEIQEEIQNLLSETGEDEQEVEKDLQRLGEKIEYLEENTVDARDPQSLESITDLFIEACHHLTEDVRAEKEMRSEIKQLEEDERTYVRLMNSIQDENLSRDRRQRLQRMIGKIPREKVESALKEDRKLEKNEETRTIDQIDRLSQVFKDLSHNLKGRRMASKLEDAREAWVQLTHLESHVY